MHREIGVHRWFWLIDWFFIIHDFLPPMVISCFVMENSSHNLRGHNVLYRPKCSSLWVMDYNLMDPVCGIPFHILPDGWILLLPLRHVYMNGCHHTIIIPAFWVFFLQFNVILFISIIHVYMSFIPSLLFIPVSLKHLRSCFSFVVTWH